VLDRLRQIPAVEGAGMVNWLPLQSGMLQGNFSIEGRPTMPKGYVADKLVTTPGYFRVMGVPLIYGRDFAPRDDGSGTPVMIMSRSVARRFWPPDGAGAIGQRITQADGTPTPKDWLTIVGVVDDVAQQAVTVSRDRALYFPLAQNDNAGFIRDVTFVVRTAQRPTDIGPLLRAVVHQADPGLAVQQIRSMDDVATDSMADARFEARLLALFAALALLLAAVGTYGVLAYNVAARTHEIGLRVALGADRSDIGRLVLGSTLGMALPGIVLGLAGSAAVTGVLTKSLFQVKPTDPATLASVAVTLLAVALVAALGPMLRAASVDPLVALKSE
jgi:putative ABC transport system permease protein